MTRCEQYRAITSHSVLDGHFIAAAEVRCINNAVEYNKTVDNVTGLTVTIDVCNSCWDGIEYDTVGDYYLDY